eukprot:TRINITY_DN7515_c0_g1_i1.p1 TRINITY_DN7515_c0_g1~~TRINITY_DN7515_c0_g1_i1.p1  ORF type:complete len:135 (-),score=8.55 TRINITY_DN7515_c0_g1_i1:276-680(-)
MDPSLFRAGSREEDARANASQTSHAQLSRQLQQQQDALEALLPQAAAAGAPLDSRMLPAADKFSAVQTILDHNRLLIHEIKRNHETRDEGGLRRNVTLIRELNSNISRVVELYAEISKAFVVTFGRPPRGNSDG